MANSQGGAGTKKHGRNKEKCAKYRTHKVREKNKIKKVLQSNGYTYAEKWAKANGVVAELNKLMI